MNSMANQVQSGLATGSEGLVCFVCDVGVVGRYYALATCRTQTTKLRLIEKLGQLVGDDYMVVISEDDVICRGCATMINSLDRLEKEVGSLRSIILRYLEKKYDMEDGELVNARANPQSHSKQPPKETKSSSSPTDFQSRKRKAMSCEVDAEDSVKDSSGKDSVWLQCDRCKYTTHYNSYMVHHVRSQHSHQHQHQHHNTNSRDRGDRGHQPSLPPPPPPSQQITVNNSNTEQHGQHNGDEKSTTLIHHIQPITAVNQHNTTTTTVIEEEEELEEEEEVDIKKDLSTISEASTTAETVEMIAAEIGQDFDRRVVATATSAGDSGEQHDTVAVAVAVTETQPSSSPTTTSSSSTTVTTTTTKQVTLQAVEGEDGNNTICMVDENGMIVQKVEQAEDGTLYVQMGASDSADNTKQVLSVGEDGSVQMVEVLWEDMVNSEENDSHTMVTF